MAKARDRRRTLDGFAEINHDAAGIDVGNAQHWVAVPAGRDAESVRRVDTVTPYQGESLIQDGAEFLSKWNGVSRK